MKKQQGKSRITIIIGSALGIGALIYFINKAKAAPPEPPPGLANLYGKVTDSITGAPLSGVLVTLDGTQALTGGQGNYSFADLEPGSYTVTFEKEGYASRIY